MTGDPVIDPRTGEQIIDQAMALRSVYTPEWTPTNDDHGVALIAIFARLLEILLSRLNRVPEKNFLAFLDTAGVNLLPPNAARVPVKFVATAGAKGDGVVPAGTPLATSPPSGQEPVSFETEDRLVVSRSQLVYLFSHDPNADSYTDQQAVVASNEKNESLEFQAFAGTAPIPHRLYLSQDTLFQIGHPTQLTLRFTLDSMSNAIVDLFQKGLRWTIQSSGEQDITPPPPPAANVRVSGNTVTVCLDSPLLSTIDQTKVDGVAGYWLRVETMNALSQDEAGVTIQSVTVTSTASNIQPALAFFNAAPLDTTRGIYPFGDRPKTFDTFFVGVPEAFAKAGSVITLHPVYQPGTAGTTGVELTYEFWDGTAWKGLGVADATKAFTVLPGPGIDTNIQFTCPPTISPCEVNGKKSYWIRARITSGNYGEDAKMELITPQPSPPFTLDKWKYTGATFTPPIITSLIVEYAYTVEQTLTACKAENNFSFATVDLSTAFQPFVVSAENQPACYLAFTNAFSPSPVSLYVAVKEGDVAVKEEDPAEVPEVVWEYWDGTLPWKNLGVEDGTKNLTESGMVEFLGPSGATVNILFGKVGYWLRARLEQGAPSAFRILGLYLNTAWARNCVTITSEVLGSSTETPQEAFNVSAYPVLDGVQIEVREPEQPSAEELSVLLSEEGPDALTAVEGSNRETWVRWHRVDHFRFSDKKSRHYLLDWFSGRVQFGDGIQGMLPSAGHDNIRARRYQAGGGAKGNLDKNTITVLKRAIPFVDKVFNVDPAGGGSDGETIDHLKLRGPQAIKNRDRAVTREDYEWLAAEASFQVARARCLSARTKDDAGKTTLILVPASDDPKPTPSQGLIRQVRDHISTRSRRIATADLVITGPEYLEVSVSANIIPEHLGEADLIRRRVETSLQAYFHPLKGGAGGNGWEFGRAVFVSEVSKVIEDTIGVHHTENVRLSATVNGMKLKDVELIPVEHTQLVASGTHLLTVGIS